MTCRKNVVAPAGSGGRGVMWRQLLDGYGASPTDKNRLDFGGVPLADVQRMRDQNQRGFGMGGRVRGRRGPVVAQGPRVAPPGWARPSDLRAFAAYQAPGMGMAA